MFWVVRKKNINNKNYQRWQHPIEIEGNMIDQKLAYIYHNPMKAGLVLESTNFIV